MVIMFSLYGYFEDKIVGFVLRLRIYINDQRIRTRPSVRILILFFFFFFPLFCIFCRQQLYLVLINDEQLYIVNGIFMSGLRVWSLCKLCVAYDLIFSGYT